MKKEDIYSIREFDRFYMTVLRLTDKYHLHTHFTILESRLLLEINRGNNTANQLLKVLKLDKGYISRVLKKLENEQLITKQTAESDLRIKVLALTSSGKTALKEIDRRADEQISDLFKDVDSTDIAQIIAAMQKIQTELSKD